MTWEFPGNRQQSFNNQQGQAYASPVRKTNDAKIVLKKSYFRTTECLQRNKKEGWKATKWSTRSKTCSTWMTKHWLQQKRKDVPSNSQVYFQKLLFRNLNFPAKTDFSRNFSFLIFCAKNDTILVRKIMKILNFCTKIAISSNLFQYLNFRAKIQFTN